jgi:hypothetical protein
MPKNVAIGRERTNDQPFILLSYSLTYVVLIQNQMGVLIFERQWNFPSGGLVENIMKTSDLL